jgi:hypothetical protein
MKARNIIPGWPRGRSTGIPGPKPFMTETNELFVRRIYIDGLNGPHNLELLDNAEKRWWEDWIDYCVEERRKAAMMEEYWWIQREIAAGRYPWPSFHPIFHVSSA